jgi:hypothetical protein
MNLARLLRRPAHAWPFGAGPLGIVAAYAGTVISVWIFCTCSEQLDAHFPPAGPSNTTATIAAAPRNSPGGRGTPGCDRRRASCSRLIERDDLL